MKKNYYLIGGVIYVALPFVFLVFQWGQIQESYTVDFSLVIGGIGSSVVPFVLGLLAGKWRG